MHSCGGYCSSPLTPPCTAAELSVAGCMFFHAWTIAVTVRSWTSLRYDVGTPPHTPAVSGPPCEWSESTTISDGEGTGGAAWPRRLPGATLPLGSVAGGVTRSAI